MKTVKVEVLADNFGTHKKGDVLQMEKSTANACVVHKKVKIITEEAKK